MTDRRFYSVIGSLWHVRLPNHLEQGYETERDFRSALRKILDLWRGRVGECIEERNGFCRLRFHDTPGGKPDEAWIPVYLLQPTDMPAWMEQDDDGESSEIMAELDAAFGFD